MAGGFPFTEIALKAKTDCKGGLLIGEKKEMLLTNMEINQAGYL